MGSEIEQPFQVVSPRTGEVLSQHAATADLAGFLLDVRELEGTFKDQKSLVGQELMARMDKGAKWTLHEPGLKITAPSPKPDEYWDAPGLREALLLLVDRGVLDITAVDAAVETIVSYRTKKAGINALRALGGEAAEIVNNLASTVEKTRYVSVNAA